MAQCISYECDEALISHALNTCGEELLAGGSGMILLACGHQLTDASSAAQIAAEILAGRAVLMDNVKIGIDAAAAVEVDSNIVGASQTLVTYNRSGTVLDSNVSDANRAFYDQLYSGKTYGGAVVYIKGTEESTGGALVTFINDPVKFIGSLPIQNNNDQIMVFTGSFKWRSKAMPTLVAAPTGVFT